MKTTSLIIAAIFSTSALLAADPHQAAGKRGKGKAPANASPKSPHIELLRLEGRFDGSGKFSFTRKSAKYSHKHWDAPGGVHIDGVPWAELEKSPEAWKEIAGGLDLTKAWIVKREGRDVIALERTPDGFDLWISDSPNGAAKYAVTIAIPRRR